MISTHILDTSLGHPASGVEVQLQKKSGADWKEIDSQKTNSDGRISFSCPPNAGVYRLEFLTAPYFQKNKTSTFFPHVHVTFEITDTARKYHVPLLLNPFSYSTYRGS